MTGQLTKHHPAVLTQRLDLEDEASGCAERNCRKSLIGNDVQIGAIEDLHAAVAVELVPRVPKCVLVDVFTASSKCPEDRQVRSSSSHRRLVGQPSICWLVGEEGTRGRRKDDMRLETRQVGAKFITDHSGLSPDSSHHSHLFSDGLA